MPGFRAFRRREWHTPKCLRDAAAAGGAERGYSEVNRRQDWQPTMPPRFCCSAGLFTRSDRWEFWAVAGNQATGSSRHNQKSHALPETYLSSRGPRKPNTVYRLHTSAYFAGLAVSSLPCPPNEGKSYEPHKAQKSNAM
jgi:hypothetical protein